MWDTCISHMPNEHVVHILTDCFPSNNSKFIHMSTQEAHRKVRKDCKYDAGERKAITGYKHEYRSQTTRQARVVMLKNLILPAEKVDVVLLSKSGNWTLKSQIHK